MIMMLLLLLLLLFLLLLLLQIHGLTEGMFEQLTSANKDD